MPTHSQRVERIRDSIDELDRAGINLLSADGVMLRRLVREHLDFLQCMVGYDASLHELVDLIDSQRAVATEYLN
jgi:hypothetical protein